MTALKAAGLLGAASGGAVFLRESNLIDDNIINGITEGNIALASRVTLDRLSDTGPIIRGVVKGTVVASVLPLSVVLTKKVLSFVKQI